MKTVNKLRSTYYNLSPPHRTRDPLGEAINQDLSGNRFDRVQFKYDGQWARLDVVGGVYTLSSRNGGVLKTGTFDVPEGAEPFPSLVRLTLVGEWMPPQSVWAQKNGLVGTFHPFDIVSTSTFDERMKELDSALWELSEFWIWPVKTFNASLWLFAWQNHVDSGGWEGLVFKKSGGLFGEPVGRMKYEATVDLVCMGFNFNKKGEVRSIRGGVYADGELKEVCAVPVLLKIMKTSLKEAGETLLGCVLEVTGNGVFPSGAVRHPRFNRWRPEKDAIECIQNEGVKS